jgi:hypothetical protein
MQAMPPDSSGRDFPFQSDAHGSYGRVCAGALVLVGLDERGRQYCLTVASVTFRPRATLTIVAIVPYIGFPNRSLRY